MTIKLTYEGDIDGLVNDNLESNATDIRAYARLCGFEAKEITGALERAGKSGSRSTFRSEFREWLVLDPRSDSDVIAYIDAFVEANGGKDDKRASNIARQSKNLRAQAATAFEIHNFYLESND